MTPASEIFLTVTDCFALSGLGLIIAPDVSPEVAGISDQGHRARVRITRPDGSQEVLEATFYWEHANPGGSRYRCTFATANEDQVPPGTQLRFDASELP